MILIDKVLDEGNCGEVTNRGEEACECVVKLTSQCRRQPHSRQSCEATDRNSIQGRCGQASEPSITKPFSFIRIGKSGACAAKAIRLIQGDPPQVSARPIHRQAEPSSVRGGHVDWSPNTNLSKRLEHWTPCSREYAQQQTEVQLIAGLTKIIFFRKSRGRRRRVGPTVSEFRKSGGAWFREHAYV